MPAALPVDRDAVKAHALQHGVRQAARDFDISEDAVRKWSEREGWFKPGPVTVLPPTMRQSVTNVTKPSVAAASALERYNKGGKLALAKTVRKASVHLSRKKPDELLERVPAILGLASAHAKLFPEQTQANQLVQINFASSLPEYLKPCGTSPAPQLPTAPVEEE